MRPRTARVLHVLLVLVVYIACIHGVKLAKIHVVDYVSRLDGTFNILFRGDMPRNDSVSFSDCGSAVPFWDCFGYSELIEFMTIKARNESSISLPAAFSLVDYSLLSGMEAIEETDLHIEESFFFQFPDLGQLVHWPFYGAKDCPSEYSRDSLRNRALAFDQWDLDLLHSRSQILYQTLHTVQLNRNDSLPTVMYWHCEHGMDRSGELGIAYQIRFLGWSWSRAKQYADSVGSRPIQIENACNAQWYCLYLQFSMPQQFGTLDCLA